MPVYYGGDLYDSEDSDWDDPYALASAAYLEDYNFDIPEGMYSAQQYACVRGASLGVFSARRISLTLTGCSVCVGGLVDCSDCRRADCVVDFSPVEVRISYIRPGLWTDSLIDAAPVTGSLIDSVCPIA